MNSLEPSYLKRRYEDAFGPICEDGPEQKRQCCSGISRAAIRDFNNSVIS